MCFRTLLQMLSSLFLFIFLRGAVAGGIFVSSTSGRLARRCGLPTRLEVSSDTRPPGRFPQL